MTEFTIPIEPKPKKRPRFGNGVTYTPKETTEYESIVALYARRAIKRVLNGEIYVTIHFYLKTPKSWSKRKKQLAETKRIRPAVTPDIDNLAKAVLDGMNGIAFSDDRLIVDLTLRKFYSEKPRVMVAIEEITSNDEY